MKGRLALIAALVAVGPGCSGCDDKATDPVAAPPDAGRIIPTDPRIDRSLGLELAIPPRWVLEPKSAAEREAGIVLAARREPTGSQPYLVAPRLVITKKPLDGAIDVETLLDRSIAATRDALPPAQARTKRTTTSRWMIGDVRVASFQLNYAVLDSKGGPDREVIQRSVVATREDDAGALFSVHIDVTYLGTDDEALGREVEGVLRSLNFTARQKRDNERDRSPPP